MEFLHQPKRSAFGQPLTHNAIADKALLRRKSGRTFETDSPPILVKLLRAQGWTFLAWCFGRKKMTHMLAEHMDYGEIQVYESGLVIASGDEVIGFLNSLVEWCGGER